MIELVLVILIIYLAIALKVAQCFYSIKIKSTNQDLIVLQSILIGLAYPITLPIYCIIFSLWVIYVLYSRFINNPKRI